MKRLLEKVWFNMLVLAIYMLVIPMLMTWGLFSFLKLVTGTAATDYPNNTPLLSISLITSYVVIISLFKYFFTDRVKKG